VCEDNLTGGNFLGRLLNVACRHVHRSVHWLPLDTRSPQCSTAGVRQEHHQQELIGAVSPTLFRQSADHVSNPRFMAVHFASTSCSMCSAFRVWVNSQATVVLLTFARFTWACPTTKPAPLTSSCAIGADHAFVQSGCDVTTRAQAPSVIHHAPRYLGKGCTRSYQATSAVLKAAALS
jgi:hypothetical protein